jgi:hypothetical protein
LAKALVDNKHRDAAYHQMAGTGVMVMVLLDQGRINIRESERDES